jgi:hypothetical protein
LTVIFIQAALARMRLAWRLTTAVLRRPYTTSEQQVLDFFAGYNVNEVAFVYEPDGRPSGLVRIGSEELVQLCSVWGWRFERSGRQRVPRNAICG